MSANLALFQGPGEKAEWRNSGMAEWRNRQGKEKKWNGGIAEWTLLLICTSWKFMPCKGTCMEIYALQGHVHGNLCLARECVWKFMPCKGVATIEATASVKVSALA